MAKVYVNLSLGTVTKAGVVTTGGTGTGPDPYYTLQEAMTACSNGDTIKVTGTGRKAGTLTSKTDVTIESWRSGESEVGGGAEKFFLRGDVPLAAADWTLESGTTYQASIGAAISIATVAYKWDTTRFIYSAGAFSADANGPFHGGHLAAAATLVACRAAANSWFFDGATNILYVNLNGDNPQEEPNGSVAWNRLGSGIILDTCTRCWVQGADVALWCGEATSTYGVKLTTCTNCGVRDSKCRDGGYHSFGCEGNACVGNIIRNCQMSGQRGDYHTVFYSGAGSVSGVGLELEFHLYNLLTRTGTKLESAKKVGACYAHTDGTVGTIANVEYRDCDAYGYAGHPASSVFGMGGKTSAVTAANEDNWKLYPLRYVNCRAINCDKQSLTDAGTVQNVAYVNCEIDLTRETVANSWHIDAGGVEKKVLLINTLTGNNGTGVVNGGLFWLQNGAKVIRHNSILFNLATDGAGYTDKCIFKISGTSVIKGRRSIHHMGSAGPFGIQDTNTARVPSEYDDENCWYNGFGATWFMRDHVGPPAASTKAQWTTEVDPTGVYDVVPGFISLSTFNAKPVPGAAMLSKVAPGYIVGTYHPLDPRGFPFSGCYGPYQKPRELAIL